MNKIVDILSGIGILIALYLILSKGDAMSQLITSVMSNGINGIKVLQGRG